MQRGHRSEAIHSETKVILRAPMGWCAVSDGFMHPLKDFMRGPLCRPRIEVQKKAASNALFKTYHLDFHAQTIRSLEWDEHLREIRTMVCLQFAIVVPEQEDSVTRICGSYISVSARRWRCVALSLSGISATIMWACKVVQLAGFHGSEGAGCT